MSESRHLDYLREYLRKLDAGDLAPPPVRQRIPTPRKFHVKRPWWWYVGREIDRAISIGLTIGIVLFIGHAVLTGSWFAHWIFPGYL